MHHEPMNDIEQLYMDGLSHWLCKNEIHNDAYLSSFDWSNDVSITTSIPSDTDNSFDFSLVETLGAFK